MPDRKTRTGWMAIAVLFFLVQLAYFVMPVDLIPDVVPVLGFLDDLVVTLISLAAAAAAGSYAMQSKEQEPDQIDGPHT